ncbi:TPA: hypothetical protein DDW35_13625 [Candidatus Sumerlaeota bacterium]|jgi:nucleoside-diphosphate-sugar epimerase|nr:hypothetical protein [Candidatus Sumerlaeota bacterium]
MLLITGANGFLGSAIVRQALQRGIAVRAMVRPGSSIDLLADFPSDHIVEADLEKPESLELATRGCTAVINCAGTTSEAAPDLELSRRTNVEGLRALLAACAKNGARRFIQMSSQSSLPTNASAYGKTKWEAEQVLRASAGIDWTILKPSIIYGPQLRGIFAKMVAHCDKLPVMPIIGSGNEEQRPVHVDDVAVAALDCLATPATIGGTYDLGGKDVLSFTDFVKAIIRARGRKTPCFHLPVPIALVIATVLSTFLKNPPLTPDNVRGIKLAPHVDNTAAERDFHYNPRTFEDGLQDLKK